MQNDSLCFLCSSHQYWKFTSIIFTAKNNDTHEYTEMKSHF